jgi:phospholipid/cholesterol/gamma-HCH transport system substrate-binding protein
MSRMGTEFKVGIFTLLGLAATAIAVFFVSPELFDRKQKTLYFTILKDASGILENTHVKTNGVNIGRVSLVKLSENATRIELELLADVTVPQGSEIAVRTVGFLGDRYIDVVRPDTVQEKIAPGGFIPRSTDSADIAEVVKQVGSIAADIKKVTENLAAVLGDRRGEEKMSNIVDNIESMTSEASTILAENRQDVRAAIANFRELSASLKDVVNPENRERIDRILAKFDDSMTEVRGASENIRLISERIEKGQGTIGRLVNDDKTLEELEGAVKEIRQVLAPVSKLQVAVDTHAELRTDDSSQTYFNVRLLTRPDSYYMVGFTDYNERIVDTTTETIDSDPTGDNSTRIRERVKDERALRFNLQVAKRWGWIGARLGLFESTGGLASDMYFFKDRLRLSLEAFDFVEKGNETRRIAHLKTYASVLFFDHLVAVAGWDDITRRQDPLTGKRDSKPNVFFGAGLSFNDQDLKAFFGLATVATQ